MDQEPYEGLGFKSPFPPKSPNVPGGDATYDIPWKLFHAASNSFFQLFHLLLLIRGSIKETLPEKFSLKFELL